MRKILSALLVLVMVVSLAACGGSVSGTYKATKVKSEGMELTKDSELWKTAFGDTEIILELKDDNTFSLTGMDDAGGNGTYTVDGETLNLTAEGETMSATVKDGTVELSIEGQSITFEK